MSDEPKYEKFLCAPGMRLDAHERITAVHQDNLTRRMARVEELMERLEKRLWLTVYGVVAMVLAEAVQSFLAVAP